MSPPKTPSGGKKKAGKLSLPAVVILVLLFGSWFGLLDGAWVGIFVGGIFLALGLVVFWSTFFGGYEGKLGKALFQAPGRLLLAGLLIFLGGLGVVSATSDLWPTLNFKQPWFGDLRTLFWGKERFTEMACHHAEDGPPEALRFALERAPRRRLLCRQPDGTELPLLDLAETNEIVAMLVAAGQHHRGDLDRKLIDLCREGASRLPAIESLLGAGANPNAEIGYDTALSAALDNEQTTLAIWLLEHGAQANYTFQNGETLLERTQRSGRVDLMPVYAEMLRSHGADEKPKLEQTRR